MGSFHAFAGVPLHIEDDGRHVWIDGPGLQRAIGRANPKTPRPPAMPATGGATPKAR
jgi:streptogramin lyase